MAPLRNEEIECLGNLRSSITSTYAGRVTKFQHVEAADGQHCAVRAEVDGRNWIIVGRAREQIRSLGVPDLVARVFARRRDQLRVRRPRNGQNQSVMRLPLHQLAVGCEGFQSNGVALTIGDGRRVRRPASAHNQPLVLHDRRPQQPRSRENLHDAVLAGRQQPRPVRAPSRRSYGRVVRVDRPFNPRALVQDDEATVRR